MEEASEWVPFFDTLGLDFGFPPKTLNRSSRPKISVASTRAYPETLPSWGTSDLTEEFAEHPGPYTRTPATLTLNRARDP